MERDSIEIKNPIKRIICGFVFEHTSAVRPKCCAQSSSACNVPSLTLIWSTSSSRSGAVERSPGYVQFINAGVLGANQATSERPRVASVSVALIVLPTVVPSSASRGSNVIRSPGSALTEIRRSGFSGPRTVSTGLTLMFVDLSHLFRCGHCVSGRYKD